ncbi:MAG: undecaprenyl-diphosphate phosphatase [Pseudomonadota bacterium]
MDGLIYLKAVILGVLEGATEFLPVSSTGHLIIASELMDFRGDTAKTFDIFIQLGAILAIVWHYRARVANVSRGLVHGEPAARRFVTHLLIAFLPAAVLGFALHSFIKGYLFNAITVASALIVGGFIILWVESRANKPKVHSVDEMTARHALLVGLAQSAALFPGVSRAGATIMGGMLSGLSREAATEFSFFLAIPTMFAATTYDLFKSRHLLHGEHALLFATGFIFAFISALIVVRTLLHFVSRYSFRPFAYYRIVFGTLILLLAGAGVVTFQGI